MCGVCGCVWVTSGWEYPKKNEDPSNDGGGKQQLSRLLAKMLLRACDASSIGCDSCGPDSARGDDDDDDDDATIVMMMMMMMMT